MGAPAAALPVGLPTTLVVGARAGAREAAIAARLDGGGGVAAAILEGLPDGQFCLEAGPTLLVKRIAPACLCCAGNLVLRVTLNRLLRERPARLYIGLASAEHVTRLRSWLSTAPYDQLLTLTPDLAT